MRIYISKPNDKPYNLMLINGLLDVYGSDVRFVDNINKATCVVFQSGWKNLQKYQECIIDKAIANGKDIQCLNGDWYVDIGKATS